MATATQIAERALKRLGIVQSGESASSVDIADASEALNAMIESWNAEGLSGNAIPYDSRFEHGIIAMLAVRIAEDYGVTPGQVVVRDADNGWLAIQAAHFAVPESKFETALINSGPFGGDDIILNAPSNYGAWAASTDYDLRTFVVNGSNLYECTMAGTSASSGGPSGTETSITDGTVVWCWRRVTG